MTHDTDHWYFTQSNYIWKIPVPKSLELFIDQVKWHGPIPVKQAIDSVAKKMGLASKKLPLVLEKEGYIHFGDLACHQGKLFVPVEGGAKPIIAVFDTNLIYLGCFHLTKIQDSVPWCAINPLDGLLYSSNTNTNYLCKYTIPWDALNQTSPNLNQSLKLTVENAITLDYAGSLNLLDEQENPLELRVLQGAAFSDNGLLFTLNGYCQISALFKDQEDFKKWKQSNQSWKDITGLSVFNTFSGKRIKKSINKQGTGGFYFEYRPKDDQNTEWTDNRWSCPDRAEKPEGITFWDLDSVAEKHDGISGQLHAILSCTDQGTDDVFFKHYRVEVEQ